MRESWDGYFLRIAEVVASRSTCDRARVGAVLTRNNHILSTGFNGSASGLEHCDDVGHLMIDGHCVSGATVIPKFQTKQYNTGHRTIEFIYESWQSSLGRTMMKKMLIRSINEKGVIVPDKITDVWKSGEKDVFKITTRLGRSVVTTRDHLFYTDLGWKTLGSLSVGGVVALNGIPLYEDRDWLVARYVTDQMDQLAISKLIGCGRTTIKRKLDEFGIERRVKEFGGWNKGFRREESHSYKGAGVSPAHARARSGRYTNADMCRVCGETENIQIHHIDGNVYNDRDENFAPLCVPCHNLAHTPFAKRERFVLDVITNIEYVGVQPVYDLTTEKNHNFVGDGFILHNCVRTVHAEANAIVQVALHIASTDGCTAYVTHMPCINCSKLLINAGVARIVYMQDYRVDENALSFLKKSGVNIVWFNEGM